MCLCGSTGRKITAVKLEKAALIFVWYSLSKIVGKKFNFLLTLYMILYFIPYSIEVFGVVIFCIKL